MRYRIDRREKIGNAHRHDQEGGNPEYVIVGEERQEREHADQLQLKGVAAVRHPFRQSVQIEIEHTDQHNPDKRQNDDPDHENIGLARPCNIERQVANLLRCLRFHSPPHCIP